MIWTFFWDEMDVFLEWNGRYRPMPLLQILYDGAVSFYVPLFIQIEKQVALHCNSWHDRLYKQMESFPWLNLVDLHLINL